MPKLLKPLTAFLVIPCLLAGDLNAAFLWIPEPHPSRFSTTDSAFMDQAITPPGDVYLHSTGGGGEGESPLLDFTQPTKDLLKQATKLLKVEDGKRALEALYDRVWSPEEVVGFINAAETVFAGEPARLITLVGGLFSRIERWAHRKEYFQAQAHSAMATAHVDLMQFPEAKEHTELGLKALDKILSLTNDTDTHAAWYRTAAELNILSGSIVAQQNSRAITLRMVREAVAFFDKGLLQLTQFDMPDEVMNQIRIQALPNLSILYLTWATYEDSEKHTATAEGHIQEALGISPDSLPVILAQSLLEMHRKNWKGAIQGFLSCWQMGHQDDVVASNLQIAYMNFPDYTASLEWFQKIKTPLIHSRYNEGLAYFMRKKYRKSETVFSDMQKDPDFARALKTDETHEYFAYFLRARLRADPDADISAIVQAAWDAGRVKADDLPSVLAAELKTETSSRVLFESIRRMPGNEKAVIDFMLDLHARVKSDGAPEALAALPVLENVLVERTETVWMSNWKKVLEKSDVGNKDLKAFFNAKWRRLPYFLQVLLFNKMVQTVPPNRPDLAQLLDPFKPKELNAAQEASQNQRPPSDEPAAVVAPVEVTERSPLAIQIESWQQTVSECDSHTSPPEEAHSRLKSVNSGLAALALDISFVKIKLSESEEAAYQKLRKDFRRVMDKTKAAVQRLEEEKEQAAALERQRQETETQLAAQASERAAQAARKHETNRLKALRVLPELLRALKQYPDEIVFKLINDRLASLEMDAEDEVVTKLSARVIEALKREGDRLEVRRIEIERTKMHNVIKRIAAGFRSAQTSAAMDELVKELFALQLDDSDPTLKEAQTAAYAASENERPRVEDLEKVRQSKAEEERVADEIRRRRKEEKARIEAFWRQVAVDILNAMPDASGLEESCSLTLSSLGITLPAISERDREFINAIFVEMKKSEEMSDPLTEMAKSLLKFASEIGILSAEMAGADEDVIAVIVGKPAEPMTVPPITQHPVHHRGLGRKIGRLTDRAVELSQKLEQLLGTQIKTEFLFTELEIWVGPSLQNEMTAAFEAVFAAKKSLPGWWPYLKNIWLAVEGLKKLGVNGIYIESDRVIVSIKGENSVRRALTPLGEALLRAG